MGIRAILILGFLGLTVVAASLAQKQPGNLAKPNQQPKVSTRNAHSVCRCSPCPGGQASCRG